MIITEELQEALAEVVRSTTVEEYEAAVARYETEADRLRAINTPVAGKENSNEGER